jgi:anaerobic selenocysteine-containing dehydrogenase
VVAGSREVAVAAAAAAAAAAAGAVGRDRAQVARSFSMIHKKTQVRNMYDFVCILQCKVNCADVACISGHLYALPSVS